MGRKEDIGRRAAEAFEVANRRGIQPARDALGKISIPTRAGVERSTANAFWEASRLGFRYKIEGQEYLDQASQRLSSGDWVSAIIYYNNMGIPGAAMIVDAIGKNVTPINMIAGIAEFDRPLPNPGERFPSRIFHRAEYGIIKGVSRAKGFDFIPGTDEEHEADRANPDKFRADTAQAAVDFLKVQGHVLVIPQPTKDGALIRANPRLATISRIAAGGTFLLPAGIVSSTRRLAPPYSNSRLVFGEPVAAEEIMQELEELEASGRRLNLTMTDLIMRRQVKLIQRKRQGYYRPFVRASQLPPSAQSKLKTDLTKL